VLAPLVRARRLGPGKSVVTVFADGFEAPQAPGWLWVE